MIVRHTVEDELWMRVETLSRKLATGIDDRGRETLANVVRHLQQQLHLQHRDAVSVSRREPVEDEQLYYVIADVTLSPDGNSFLQEVANATRQADEPIRESLQ